MVEEGVVVGVEEEVPLTREGVVEEEFLDADGDGNETDAAFFPTSF